jgi:hypothetical protein
MSCIPYLFSIPGVYQNLCNSLVFDIIFIYLFHTKSYVHWTSDHFIMFLYFIF